MALKRKKIIPRIFAADSAYIDPLGCDSTISYKVTKRRYLSGSVSFSDCNRKIEWYFGDDKASLTKIEKAIEMLQKFRAEFGRAQAESKRKRVVKRKIVAKS